MANIVKNEDKAYGYKYTSLASLAKQNINIPKMRTKVTEFGEYVEWFDEKTNEWQQGAKVIPMELKGMNAAQSYGSALTYARRYTVQMAESVACDDDQNIETKDENRARSSETSNSKLDFEFVKTMLENCKTVSEVNNFAIDVNKKYPKLSAKQRTVLSGMFQDARLNIEQVPTDAELREAGI